MHTLYYVPYCFTSLQSISGHSTGHGDAGKNYRPLFLDHFDKKEVIIFYEYLDKIYHSMIIEFLG